MEYGHWTSWVRVRTACKKKNIFPCLFTIKKKKYTKAPWIVPNKEIDKVNKRLIDLKAPARIRTPFTTNGGVTCHDKIVFATEYARNVFQGMNNSSPHIMENMLCLFDMMKYLRQSEFQIEEHKNKLRETIHHLRIREGLLPAPIRCMNFSMFP